MLSNNIEIGDYLWLNEDLRVICTDGIIRKIEKNCLLRIHDLRKEETILGVMPDENGIEFYFDVGGIAFGLFPPEEKNKPWNNRFSPYKDITGTASSYSSVYGIINTLQCVQISDENEISDYVLDIINSNLDKVKKFKEGNEKLFGFFIGQTMKKYKCANPDIVNRLMRKYLDEIKEANRVVERSGPNG